MPDKRKPLDLSGANQILNSKRPALDLSGAQDILKKKVASKRLSQEELWGSSSQPQDLFTSLATGKQVPQQVSDASDGQPKMKQFTGFTPEELKTLQDKPVVKVSKSAELIDKRLKLQNELSNTKVTPKNQEEVSRKTNQLSSIIKEQDKIGRTRLSELEQQFKNSKDEDYANAEAENRLNNLVSNTGVWNNIKSNSIKVYNSVVDELSSLTDEAGIKEFKLDTDPLSKEKNEVIKDALKKKIRLNENQVNEAAKRLYKDKQVEFIETDRINSFLDNLSDEDKNLLKQDRYNKSVHLQEDNVKQEKIINAYEVVGSKKIKEYQDIEKELLNLKSQNKELPKELYDSYINLGFEIKGISDNISKRQSLLQKNKEDLGDVNQEFDFFKRQYGDIENFIMNTGSMARKLAINTLGGLDYLGTLGGLVGDKEKNIGVQNDVIRINAEIDRQRDNLRKSVESIESPEGFVNYVSDIMSNQIPSLVATSTGAGGLATIGLSTAGEKYADMNREVIEGKATYSPLQMASVPLLYGGAEVISEIPTLSILKKGGRLIESIAKNDSDLITKSVKEKAKEWAKDWSVDTGKEIAGEEFTNFAQNFTDKYILGKKDVGLLDNAGTVLKDTFTLTNILKAAPHVAGAILKPHQSNTDLLVLDENSRKIVEFTSQLDSNVLTEKEKIVIAKQRDKLVSKNSEIIANTIDKVDNMPVDIYKKVIELNDKAASIKSEAVIINEGNLPNKKELLKELSVEYKLVKDQRNALIDAEYKNQSPLQEAFDKLDESKKIKLKNEASRLLIEDARQRGLNEFEFNDKTITEKAIELFKKEDTKPVTVEEAVEVVKPTEEQILKDISEGNLATFTYKNKNEVPDAFKDKISSEGEVNGEKFVRVTVSKSLADYELSKAEKPAVEEVKPTVEEVKPTEVAVKPSGQKVADIINRPATLESQAGVKLETPIEGDVYQEGQRVIFEDKNKKTYDLGNIDEVSDKTVEELGIKPQEEMVSVTPEGKIKVGENQWNMQLDLPNYGIEYDQDGNVKAVSLKDDAGKTVMYEGQVAEDAAYQVLLNQAETPEQRQAINEILENDEELNRQLREAEEAAKAAAAEVTEPGAQKTKAEQYSQELDRTKESDPEAYWSVSPVSAEDAAKGTIIDTPDGAVIVKPDGDIAGLFKKATSKAKGVAQDLLKRAVAAGGKKLDNFDTYLTPQYIKAGFRVVSRVPFSLEYGVPAGYNKEKHGTPDVVAMIYDPEGKLDIEEKTFDDYDEAMAYRDSYLEIEAEIEGLTKLFDESDKGFRMSQVDNAKKALDKILPGVKFIVHETKEAYNKAVGDNSSGTYIMSSNGDRVIHINKQNANGRTVAHEVFHAVILDKIKGEKAVQEITARMVDAVYKTASPELKAKLDAFAARYSDETIRDEERLAELIGIIADGYPKMSPANKSIVKRWLDALAKMFGRKPFTDNEVIDLLNTLAGKISTGEVISEEDVDILNNINELNSKSEGSSGDQMNAAIIDRKQIKDSLDNSFKLIEYDDTNLPDNIKMPNRSTVESVIDKSGGAAIFVNSDGTKVGIRKNNTPLHGGWRYTYLVENQKDNIGFAATSSTHVKNIHGLAVKLADVRDSENEKAKGKPIAVFVTIQNADTMLGEWYAGEFFMEGIDKAINNNAFKGGVNTAKKLLIDAITYKSQIENLKKKIKEKKESLLTAKDKDKINSQIDKLKDQVKNKLEVSKKADNNRFINLINSENFNTHDGRIKIAKELSSKKFSFGYRVKLLKQLIPLKSATGSNKEIKKALLDVNNGRVDFYNEHLDEVLLNKMKETNYDETSIGGISLGGFFMDPYMSFDNFYNNRKNGIKHAQFNESFTSNGDTFSLDSVINVNKLAPEMGYPTNKGYELYNSSNKTNFTKKNTTLNDRFKIANFLYKETNNNSKYLTPPFTSIGGSMYTSTVFDQKTTEEKTIIRKQIVGENANLSQNVRDNLDVARNMESSKKSDKEIRLATGWERGADNKWRYEVPDNIPFLKDTVKTVGVFLSEDKDTNQLSQKASYFLPKELLDLYPQLNDITIKFDNVGDESAGSYDPTTNTIEVSIGLYPSNTVSSLIHEVQHAIQEIEGFAEGGGLAASAKLAILSLEKKLGKRIESTTRKEMVSLKLNKREESFRTFILNSFYKAKNQKQLLNLIDKESYSVYKKLAGEVESRNVERRMNATPEERRRNTLQETEDVAREDQIIFFKRSQLQGEGVNTVSESFFNDADKIFPNDHILGGYAVTDSKGKLIGRVKLSEVDDNTVKIDEVVSEKKGERTGNGSAIMKMVIDNADKNNTRLTLTANLILGIKAKGFETAKKLQSFYEKFGFIKGANGLMTREPVISKRLQQAKTIDEMVRIARQSNYSDAAITAFLKSKGFSDTQIANAMSRPTITEEEAYDKFNAEFKKSKEEITNKKTVKEYIKQKYQNIIKNWSNRQAEAQSLLSKTGMVNTLNLSINSHGYSGKAKRMFEKSYDKIYKGLSTEKRNTLDKVIQAKRFIAIDNNRADRGLDPVKHPNYINKQESQMYLDKLKKEIGDKEFNDITARADEYFSTYKKLLKDVYENGLISKEAYDSMSDVDYQPRVFLQFVTDFEGDLKTPKNSVDSTSLSSDQIKSMKEGDVNSLVTNSEWLLSNSLVARTNAMAKNNINRRFMTDEFPKAKERFDKLDPKNLKGDDVRFYKYFKELQSKVIDNPIIGYTKDGNPKYKYDDLKSPINFTKAYYYIDGVQHQFFLEDGLHKSWNDNVDGFLSRDAKELISYASGSALVKAIATGNNPAFPIVNTPRDLMFTAAFSDEYSNLVPLALTQIGLDVIKSIKEISKKDSNILNKYYEYGGAMDFLSSQGKLKKDSLLGSFIDKMVSANAKDMTKTVFNTVTLKKISEYSELMFRLGIFQRSINNSLKELGVKSMSDITDKQQIDDIYNSAVASARGILDFNKGGVAAKDLESIIPYINVAFQGGSVALNAFKNNPVATTSRIFQIATMASTIPAGLSLFLIAANKGDDDEDKTAHEIYLDAISGVSKYQKSKYMNIVTGQKNEDGQYKVLKIAKAQELSPVISVTDDITENMIRKVAGKDPKSNEDIIKKAAFSLKNNVLPFDVTSPSGAIVRNPLIKAILTYQTGYDFFRDQPLAMGLEDKPAPYEGLDMKSVEGFYKDLGTKYGLSPIRSKAFIESLITTPDTNPFVGFMYGGAEAMSSNKDSKDVGKNLGETIWKSTGKRIVSYTSDFNRNIDAKQKLEKQIDEIKLKDAILKSEIKIASDRFISNEITKDQLMEEFKDLDPFDKKRAMMKIRDKKMMKDVDSNIIDIKYEKSAKVKALMIQNYYGNILDKSDDSKEVIIQMKKAGNILTQEVIYELKNAQ